MSVRFAKHVVLLLAIVTLAACNTTGPDRPVLEVYVMSGSDVIPIGSNMAVSVAVGESRQLFARLTFSDRDARDVSPEVSWSVSASGGGSGRITATGVVTGDTSGELRASAQYGPLREEISVIVEPQ